MQSVDTMSLTDAVADALIGLPRKTVAKETDTTPRAVKNWQERQNAPNAVQLVRLMQRYKTVRRAVLGFIEGPSEERLERDFQDMMRRVKALEKQLESDC